MASPLRVRRSMRVSPAVTSVAPRSPVRTARGAAKKATTTRKKAARKAPAKKTNTRKTSRRSPGRRRGSYSPLDPGGLVVPAGATWMEVVKMSKGKKNPATGKAYTFKDLSKLYRK